MMMKRKEKKKLKLKRVEKNAQFQRLRSYLYSQRDRETYRVSVSHIYYYYYFFFLPGRFVCLFVSVPVAVSRVGWCKTLPGHNEKTVRKLWWIFQFFFSETMCFEKMLSLTSEGNLPHLIFPAFKGVPPPRRVWNLLLPYLFLFYFRFIFYFFIIFNSEAPAFLSARSTSPKYSFDVYSALFMPPGEHCVIFFPPL